MEPSASWISLSRSVNASSSSTSRAPSTPSIRPFESITKVAWSRPFPIRCR